MQADLIANDDLAIVRNAIRHRLPREIRAWIFGSRAKKKARRFSDLDLAVLGNEAIPTLAIAELREDLSESDLPYRVDIVDLADCSEEFRAAIAADMVPIDL